jgi:hypothetical protein
MPKKVFFAICALMILFAIYARYFQWRDDVFLVQDTVVEEVHTFDVAS